MITAEFDDIMSVAAPSNEMLFSTSNFFDILLKNGKRLSIVEVRHNMRNTINFSKLASVVNSYISEFEKHKETKSHHVPISNEISFKDDLDRKLKSKIIMPYGIMSGMTVEEVNKCMKCAGFQFSNSTNNGQTIYYRSSIDQGIQVYSTLISAFSNGVIHVIHFFKEEDKYSKENPSINYKKILSALIDRYGKVSYSIENGSFAWVNDSVEIHFGYLVTDGILYYALAYWYLPDNIKYNGF